MPADMATGHAPARRPTRRRAGVAAPRVSADEAIATARDLARAGQHAQAVDAVSKALAHVKPDVDASLSLLELRAESLSAIGEVDRALADAEAMRALGERSGRPDLLSRALIGLARTQVLSSDIGTAGKTAELALKAARKSRKKPLVALALSNLAAVQVRLQQNADAVRNGNAAARLFDALDDELERGRAMWAVACAQDFLGRKVESERAADLALALARQTGDRWGEASALNIRWRQNIDLAKRLRGLHQALAGYRASGHVSGQAAIYNNLALAYRALGLYRRANRMAHRSTEIRRRLHAFDFVVNGLMILGGNETLAGNTDAARKYLAELEAAGSLPGAKDGGIWKMDRDWLPGLIALAERDGAAALPPLERTLPRVQSVPETSFAILVLIDLCQAYLLLGQTAAALEASRRATELYGARESRAMGAGLSPAHVWWWHHRALAATGETRQADKALETAYELLQEGIGTLSDEGLRRSYLNKISSHRAIIPAWIAYARRRRFSAKRRAAHLAGEADLRAPFERLVDTGMRLNELRSAEELHEFLVDEVTELSGAERVLLVLEGPEGFRLACSLVPVGEDALALSKVIAPWLDEARRTRATTLRYLPEGADPLEQRSFLVAPLIAQQRVLGYLYADIDGTFGRFLDTDRDLMGMLAAQAAVALDNVQWSQGLEQKVAQRTEALAASNAMLEQRAAELAIINAVQRALAGELDIQGVYDAVGEKLREVFPGSFVGIRTYDRTTNVESYPYIYYDDERRALASQPMGDEGFGPHVLRTGKTLVINEGMDEASRAYGSTMLAKVSEPKSQLIVPLMVGAEAHGMIQLSDVRREHAYGEAQVRLLETLAASMSVALENARLFNETQEALERETASSDILRVIAESPTNVTPVLDVIARHAALLSGSDDAIIGVRDGVTLLVAAHHGDIPMIPVGQGIHFNRDSVAGRAMIEGRPVQTIHGTAGTKSEFPEGDAVAARYGYRVTCAVPLLREGVAIGAIGIRRVSPELLSEAQISVIQSFASQASIAIGNVHQFNETTRLLKETEQRNAELAVINSIQHGLAGALELQAIIELVGDKLREVFVADVVGIALFDRARDLLSYPYLMDHGERFRPAAGSERQPDRHRRPGPSNATDARVPDT